MSIFQHRENITEGEKILLKVIQTLTNHKQPQNEDLRVTRLNQQIDEMNFEYSVMKTQVETLENFNSSLNAQIQRLEQKLNEANFKEIQKSIIAQGERTPRQAHLEEQYEKKLLEVQPFKGEMSPKPSKGAKKFLNMPPRQQAFSPPLENTEYNMFDDKFLVSNASRLSYFSK